MDEQHGSSVSKASPSGVGRLADFATRSLEDLETSAAGRSVSGRPLVVAADGSGDVRTVSEGIALGGSGAKLMVKPGHYQEALELTVDIEIEGIGGPSEVTIAGPDDRPTIAVQDGHHSIRNVTISGGRDGDFVAGIRGVAAVEVATGTLHLEGVTFAECPGACLRASSKYATVEVRNCSFDVGHGWLVELHDAVGGTIERCIMQGRPQGSEPLIRFSGHQTDVVFRRNVLRNGGILLQDEATPLIEGNSLEDQRGVAIEVQSAAPYVRDNRIELRWATGIVLDGLAGRPSGTYESNRIIGEHYSDAGFRIHRGSDARIVNNHVSGCFRAFGITSTGVRAELIDNTIEGCGVGVGLPVEHDRMPHGRHPDVPELSISGLVTRETDDEFSLELKDATYVGPIKLGSPARLDPIPHASANYDRVDFAASEVHVQDFGPPTWSPWDSVQTLVGQFAEPIATRHAIATLDASALGRALSLVTTAAGWRWPYVQISVADGTCELAAADNYRLAVDSLALHAGVPGRYALDADACRAAVVDLGADEGRVTFFQDDRLMTLAWTDRLVVARRQEPDLPDLAPILRPSPSWWLVVSAGALNAAVAEARASDPNSHYVLRLDGSPERGLIVSWQDDSNEHQRRDVDGASVPSAFRVGLSLSFLAEMLGAWPTSEIHLGVTARDKPIHFRVPGQPKLRYAIMPVREETPNE